MKLILTILLGLFLISPVQANNLQDVDIQFVDNINQSCNTTEIRGCYYEDTKQIFIDKNDKNIPFVLFHEICHHLQRNVQTYQEVQEEYECNVFGLWATGYDISKEDELIKKKIKSLLAYISEK